MEVHVWDMSKAVYQGLGPQSWSILYGLLMELCLQIQLSHRQQLQESWQGGDQGQHMQQSWVVLLYQMGDTGKLSRVSYSPILGVGSFDVKQHGNINMYGSSTSTIHLGQDWEDGVRLDGHVC